MQSYVRLCTIDIAHYFDTSTFVPSLNFEKINKIKISKQKQLLQQKLGTKVEVSK